MVVVVFGLVPATGAFASSLTGGHGGVSPAVTKATKSAPKAPAAAPTAASPAQTVPASTLPFTGLSLGAFALVGAFLIAVGLALRRTSRDSA